MTSGSWSRSDGLSAVSEETEDTLRLEVRGDKAEKSGGIQPSLRAPPQSAFDVCGAGDRELDGDSSAASSSDEETPITGRARILQRRGCARVR